MPITALPVGTRQTGVKHTRLPLHALTQFGGSLTDCTDDDGDGIIGNLPPSKEWPTNFPLLYSQLGLTPVSTAVCDVTKQRFVIWDVNGRRSESGAMAFRSPWSGQLQHVPMQEDVVQGILLAARARESQSSRLSVIGKGPNQASQRGPSVAVDPAGDGWMTAEERSLELHLNGALNTYTRSHFHAAAETTATAALGQSSSPATKGFVVHVAVMATAGSNSLWLSEHTISITPIRDAVKCEISSAIVVHGCLSELRAVPGEASALSRLSVSLAYGCSVNVPQGDYLSIVGDLVQAVEGHAHCDADEQLRRGLRSLHSVCRSERTSNDHRTEMQRLFKAQHDRGAKLAGSWSEPRPGEISVAAAPGFGSTAPSLAASPSRPERAS